MSKSQEKNGAGSIKSVTEALLIVVEEYLVLRNMHGNVSSDSSDLRDRRRISRKKAHSDAKRLFVSGFTKPLLASFLSVALNELLSTGRLLLGSRRPSSSELLNIISGFQLWTASLSCNQRKPVPLTNPQVFVLPMNDFVGWFGAIYEWYSFSEEERSTIEMSPDLFNYLPKADLARVSYVANSFSNFDTTILDNWTDGNNSSDLSGNQQAEQFQKEVDDKDRDSVLLNPSAIRISSSGKPAPMERRASFVEKLHFINPCDIHPDLKRKYATKSPKYSEESSGAIPLIESSAPRTIVKRPSMVSETVAIVNPFMIRPSLRNKYGKANSVQLPEHSALINDSDSAGVSSSALTDSSVPPKKAYPKRPSIVSETVAIINPFMIRPSLRDKYGKSYSVQLPEPSTQNSGSSGILNSSGESLNDSVDNERTNPSKTVSNDHEKAATSAVTEIKEMDYVQEMSPRANYYNRATTPVHRTTQDKNRRRVNNLNSAPPPSTIPVKSQSRVEVLSTAPLPSIVQDTNQRHVGDLNTASPPSTVGDKNQGLANDLNTAPLHSTFQDTNQRLANDLNTAPPHSTFQDKNQGLVNDLNNAPPSFPIHSQVANQERVNESNRTPPRTRPTNIFCGFDLVDSSNIWCH